MSFLPIVERELRERARWRSTYWIRGAAAFLATGIAGFVLLFVSATASGSVGQGMLGVLAWLAFPFVVLEGFRNTADSLSEEKREGTLGLLFLTDLRGYDVVLGKFIASSLTSFYALLAMIPALAVPVLLGGVTGMEFWRLVLALMNGLFFSLTAGTLVSSFSREERRAWTGSFALLLLFLGLLPALAAFPGFSALAQFSPATAFWLHDESRYTSQPDNFWRALWIPHLISWVWLGLASFLLPRVWQESGGRLRRAQRAAEPGQTRLLRQTQLSINPIWWLTSRHVHQRVWLWVAVLAFLAGAVPAWWILRGNVPGLWVLFGVMVLFHLLLAVWVASEAAGSFADARGSGALELLLSTPLHVRQILRGQHLALRELFLRPVVVLLSVEGLVLAAQTWLLAQQGGSVLERVMVILVFGFTLLWFVLDLFAVAEVGMWFGLTSLKSTQALTKTVLLVLILPPLCSACCFFMAFIAPGLMVAKSVIFYTWAQSKLENEFRAAATRRYDAPGKSKWFRRSPPPLRLPGN